MDRFITRTTHPAEPNSKVKRKALSPIQVHSDGNQLTEVRSVGKIAEAQKLPSKMVTKSQGCLATVKEDARHEATCAKDITCGTQTEGVECACACHVTKIAKEAEDEAYRFMTQEEIPLECWKELAEARRLALADALFENKELHEEVKKLQSKNEALVELAGHAEYFANLIKSAIDDSGVDLDQLSEDEESEEQENKQE